MAKKSKPIGKLTESQVRSVAECLQTIIASKGHLFSVSEVLIIDSVDDWTNRRNLSVAIEVTATEVMLHAHVQPGPTSDLLREYIIAALSRFKVKAKGKALLVTVDASIPQEAVETDAIT